MKRFLALSPFAGDPIIGDVPIWDGEGWVPEKPFTKWGVLQEWRSRMMTAVMEGPDIDVQRVAIGVVIGRGGDTVLLFDSAGEPVAEYAANGAGLDDALDAAGSGDVVQIPPALTLDRAITVAAGVTLRGPGKITASAALGDLITVNGRLENIEIDYTTSDSSGQVGAVYSSNGPELIRNVVVSITASGGAIPVGLRLEGVVTDSLIEGCVFYSEHTAASGVCYGVYIGTPSAQDERVVLISSVLGFAYMQKNNPTCYGMRIEGTKRTVMTGCYGIGRAQWGGGISGGILAENLDMMGCFGRGHSDGTAGSSVGIRLDTGQAVGCLGEAQGGTAKGIQLNDAGKIIGCRATAEVVGASAYGIWVNSNSCTIVGGEATSDGDASSKDLWVDSGKTAIVYGLKYSSSTVSGTLTYGQGDRACYSVEDYHADDIENASETRHLPIATALGMALVSGADPYPPGWTLTPTWKGQHTFDGGLALGDGQNIAAGTTTGTEVGTAASQKLGFYGATPVTQRAKADYNNWAALSDVVNALVALGLFDQA